MAQRIPESAVMIRATPLFPNANLSRAWPAVGAGVPLWLMAVVSMFCFLLALALTSAAVAVFILTWTFVAISRPGRAVQALLQTPVPWLLPLFAAVSIFWSVAPLTTGRHAVELLATTGMALVIVRTLDVRSFVSAYMCALLLACLVSVAVGGTSVIYDTGEVALVGVFGSKNEFSTFTSFALFCSAAVLLDPRQPNWLRCVGACGLALCPPLLWAGRSVGALVSDAVVLAIFGGLLALSHLDRTNRAVAVAGLCVLAAIAAVSLALVAGGHGVSSLLTAVGKNSTLTGRTSLWFKAEQLIQIHPFGGVGYQAFWVQESPEAEGLWRSMKIVSRYGFYFHNLFYETKVELGYAGLAILLGTIAATIIAAIRRLLAAWDVVSILFVSFLIFFVLRFYFEVDLLYPFAQGTFLFVIIWGYSTKPFSRMAKAVYVPAAAFPPIGALQT